MTANNKTVLLVDDHPLFREGLKSLLARSADFEVVGEAETGQDALEQAVRLRPDLVVMDISLPDRNGIDVTREIKEKAPKTRVLIMSMHGKVDYISRAFQAGALGYVVKKSAAENLLQGLETVSEGRYFLDTSLSREVVHRLTASEAEESKTEDPKYETLTRREQEIFRLLAQGLSARAIGDRLFISPKTVDNHRTNIKSKLGVHSVAELMRYAYKLGLIEREDVES